MNNSEELAQEWHNRALVALTAHYASARHYNSLNSRLGISASILTTIVGATVFTSLAKSDNDWLKIITGIATVIAAVLSALQTFLKFSEKAERCRTIAARYSSIGKELEIALTEPASVNRAFLEQIRVKLDQADMDAPSIPDSIRDAARNKYRKNSSANK